MLKAVRQRVIKQLWQHYKQRSSQMQHLQTVLAHKGLHHLPLDHFAIIDLPGLHSGIPQLSKLFSFIGYVEQGRDYLPEKQNAFLWMTEEDSMESKAGDVLPQAVVADFHLDALPREIKIIIEKYAAMTAIFPESELQTLSQRAAKGEQIAALHLEQFIMKYLTGRDWPLPTLREFHLVREWNELLAWVLVFGRRPNHFTLSIHLLNYFKDINEFQLFVEHEAKLVLNLQGGAIKGGTSYGISQGSTLGTVELLNLADGQISIPGDFVEFVWRYASVSSAPVLWTDYFNGFIARQATHVIESLYRQGSAV